MLRIVCCIICWCYCAVLPGQSLTKPTGQAAFKALNAYLVFANECMHVAGELRPGLEQFNAEVNLLRLAKGKGDLNFSGKSFFAGEVFRASLSGVCTKAPGDTEVQIKHLYEATAAYTRMLPPDFRLPLNEARDDLMYHLIALRAEVDSIRAYCDNRAYARDANAADAYLHLNQCVQHYEAIAFQQQRLADIRASLVRESHPALADLETLTLACRSIIEGIRLNSPMSVRMERFSLAQSITDTDRRRSESLRSLKGLGLDYDQGKVVYDHILDYGREVLTRTEEFLTMKPVSPSYLNYPRAYYYYNERLLSLFNHQKYGLLAYYNRFLRFASVPQPLHLELPPMLQLVPPIKVAPKTALVPSSATELDLEGPANHLIFLVDVSASMDKPEKMALLKSGLSELIGTLRPKDHLSMVAFATRPDVILEAVSAVRKDALQKAIKSLRTQGETNVIKGVKTAYDLAATYFIPQGNNRVILVSDGDFQMNPGLTRFIQKRAQTGVQLSVFLLSKYADADVEEHLRQLARAGKGEYIRVAAENIRETLLQEALFLQP